MAGHLPPDDAANVRFLLDDYADWPTAAFWIREGVEIPDPVRWRRILRDWWLGGNQAAKGGVLRDLRQLRKVLASPIVPKTGHVENWNDAVGRLNLENERKRRAQQQT